MHDTNAWHGTEQQLPAMEPGVSEAVTILSAQLVELHVIWDQFFALYADASTVAVLNRNSGLFFKIVQDVLWDRVLLGICRLLDPDVKGRDKNLTLRSLPPLITDVEFKAKVQQACDDASLTAKFALDHRNKRIAHQDHQYTTNPELFEMKPVSRQSIDQMLESLRAVMRLIDNHYSDKDVLYDKTVLISGADRLVLKLRRL